MFKIKQIASFVALCDETCIYFRISISKFGCHPSQLKYVLRLQKDVTRALCHGRATCHGRNTCHGSKFPNNNLNFRLESNVVMLLETTTNLCASPIIFSWEVWQNAKSLTPLETVSFVSPRTQCFQQSSLIPLEPVNQRLKSLGFHDFYEQIYPFVTLTLVISSSCLCL